MYKYLCKKHIWSYPLTNIHLGTKQFSKEEGISESAANISNPDVVPTPRDDIRDQKIAGLC